MSEKNQETLQLKQSRANAYDDALEVDAMTMPAAEFSGNGVNNPDSNKTNTNTSGSATINNASYVKSISGSAKMTPPSPINSTLQLKTEEQSEGEPEHIPTGLQYAASAAPPPYNPTGNGGDTVQMKKDSKDDDNSEAARVKELAKTISNKNIITNEIFFTRHPELNRRRLQYPTSDPAELALIQEWVDIKNRVVIPNMSNASISDPDGNEQETPSPNTDENQNENNSESSENNQNGDGSQNNSTGNPQDSNNRQSGNDQNNSGSNDQQSENQGSGDTNSTGNQSGNNSNPSSGNNSSNNNSSNQNSQSTNNGSENSGGSGEDSFDWVGTGGNIVRTVMELGRLIGPVPAGVVPIGPVCGLVANGINLLQDLKSSMDIDDTTLIVLTGLRNGTNLITGLVSDVDYCITIVQDIAAGSIIGAELLAITAPVNEALSIISVVGDLFKVSLDSATMTYSYLMASDIEASDPAKAALYRNMAQGYLANTVADSISVFFDMVDAASAGVFQGEAIDKVTKGGQAIVTFGRAWSAFLRHWMKNPALKNAILKNNSLRDAVLKGVGIGVGVWGGNLIDMVTGGDSENDATEGQSSEEPAQPFGLDDAQDFAGDYLLQRLNIIRQAYELGSDGVNALPGYISELSERAREKYEELTGSKDPFKDMMDLATEQLQNMENSIEELIQARGFLDGVKSTLTDMSDKLLQAEAALENITIPEINLFDDVDIGDNDVADLLEGVINAGAESAEELANRLRNSLQEQIDRIKRIVRDTIADIQEKLDFYYRWADLTEQTIDTQISEVGALIGRVRRALESCDNFEELVDMLLGNVSDAIGLDEQLSIERIVEMWTEMDTQIREAFSIAEEWVNTNVKNEPAQRQEGLPSGGDSNQNDTIPTDFRDSLESNLGMDVSSVNIETNSSKPNQMGALAFSQGNNLVFGNGQFDTKSSEGLHLIAHEFAHQTQNQNLKPTKEVEGKPVNDDPKLENEADQLASKIVHDTPRFSRDHRNETSDPDAK